MGLRGIGTTWGSVTAGNNTYPAFYCELETWFSKVGRTFKGADMLF